MEIILFLVAIGVISAIFEWLKETFGSNSQTGLSLDFKIRIKNEMSEDNKKSFKSIECKGVFPEIKKDTNISFITSVLDETDNPEELTPVISHFREFREPKSVCFQDKREIGKVQLLEGFTDWTRIGIIPLYSLHPPKKGNRDLLAILRMIDNNNPTQINRGFHSGPDPLYSKTFDFTYDFSEFGYQEITKNKNNSRKHAIELGMAIAMSDGNLDRSEGEKIKEWIEDILSNESENLRQELKELFNNSMKKSYEKFKSGKINILATTNALNKIADKSVKLETLELCYSVMAADGVADAAELNLLKKIATNLDVDEDAVNNIRDRAIINITVEDESIQSTDDVSTLEKVLGVDIDSSMEQKQKYLMQEFQKWSDRLNTFDEQEKREKAQKIIDQIAFLRNTYES